MIIVRNEITLTEAIPAATLERMKRTHQNGRGKNAHTYFYLTAAEETHFILWELCYLGADVMEDVAEYLTSARCPSGEVTQLRRTAGEFAEALREGERLSLSPDAETVLKKHHLTALTECRASGSVQEYLVDGERFTKKDLKDPALKRFCTASEKAEACPGSFFEIRSDSMTTSWHLSDQLLAWMDRMNDFPAGRSAVINPMKITPPRGSAEEIYTAMEGGAVVIVLHDDMFCSGGMEYLTELARAAASHSDSVRTVLCLGPENSWQLEKQFRGELGAEPIILEQGMRESPATAEFDRTEGERRLRSIARMQNADPEELVLFLDGDGPFTALDLVEALGQWNQAQKRRRKKKPLIESADTCIPGPSPEEWPMPHPQTPKPEKPKQRGRKKSAEKELEQLVGLTEAKRLLKQIADYAKLQKVMQERGLASETPCLHMVFTGNPGTAKTTVARLTARIFKECGILSVGNLIEVGRADLVGRYAGWTSQNVREKFEAAQGSVLFIDEAYSLTEDDRDSYGDEAVNTIVQEMENHRADTVVILAGYREEMQQFLKRNPGLRSRVPYHVDFPDYSEEELWQITKLKAKENGRIIAPEAEAKVRGILGAAVKQSDFGNGRFARNLVEQALLRQAERLMQGNVEDMTDRSLQMLMAEDFSAERLMEKESKSRPVGFCVPEVQTK